MIRRHTFDSTVAKDVNGKDQHSVPPGMRQNPAPHPIPVNVCVQLLCPCSGQMWAHLFRQGCLHSALPCRRMSLRGLPHHSSNLTALLLAIKACECMQTNLKATQQGKKPKDRRLLCPCSGVTWMQTVHAGLWAKNKQQLMQGNPIRIVLPATINCHDLLFSC